MNRYEQEHDHITSEGYREELQRLAREWRAQADTSVDEILVDAPCPDCGLDTCDGSCGDEEGGEA